MGEALARLRPENARHPAPPRDPGRPKGLNVLGTFAHHPELTKAFYTFNGHVLFGTTLSERQRELIVLRVAALRGSAYEWAQHAVIAGDVGLTPEELERINTGPGAGWSALDLALLQACDELVSDAVLSDATWDALRAELDVQQLMDVIFTVGTYDLLAMLLRTFGVPLDDDLNL
jgi:alkylhydroperoxidase family enzyme